MNGNKNFEVKTDTARNHLKNHCDVITAVSVADKNKQHMGFSRLPCIAHKQGLYASAD